MNSQHGYKTPITQWSDRALAKPEGATWNTWTFLKTRQHSRKDTFWKKNYFIGTHLNIRYTWCWLARTVCTFDIDGAKTKTVTGHDGERRWLRTKTWFWRGKWKPVRFSGDAKPGTTKPFYKIEIYYQNLEGQSEKRRPAGRSQGEEEREKRQSGWKDTAQWGQQRCRHSPAQMASKPAKGLHQKLSMLKQRHPFGSHS